jgi:hypothetical protein
MTTDFIARMDRLADSFGENLNSDPIFVLGRDGGKVIHAGKEPESPIPDNLLVAVGPQAPC